MTSPPLKTRLHEWEPNPVLLRELRQAMRSQSLISALMLLLAVLFLTSLAFLTRQSLSPDENLRLGQHLCRAFVVILSVATFLFVPLYIGFRLASERKESDFDLMFFTTLAPGQIVRGKLGCGMYLAAMFFSVCLPFMTFTNLLRGVDLPTVSFIVVCLYGAVCLAIQAAICFACLPLRPAVKSVAGFLFSSVLVAANAGLVALFLGLLGSGIGGSVTFWIGFAALLLLILGGVWLLHSMSVSLIAADSRPRGYFNEVIREEQA